MLSIDLKIASAVYLKKHKRFTMAVRIENSNNDALLKWIVTLSICLCKCHSKSCLMPFNCQKYIHKIDANEKNKKKDKNNATMRLDELRFTKFRKCW